MIIKLNIINDLRASIFRVKCAEYLSIFIKCSVYYLLFGPFVHACDFGKLY